MTHPVRELLAKLAGSVVEAAPASQLRVEEKVTIRMRSILHHPSEGRARICSFPVVDSVHERTRFCLHRRPILFLNLLFGC